MERKREEMKRLEDYQKCSCQAPVMPRKKEWPVAMGYVPWQHWHTVYDLDKALEAGTIFPELDQPFCGMRGGCK